MTILKWLMKPFFVILIALASAHSFSSQLLPPSRVTHEHECEYFKPSANADTRKKEDGEYLDSDTARDRYGISTVSKKSLQAMGYTITKDLPMMLYGEKALATGKDESFIFYANHSLMLTRSDDSYTEAAVSYSCIDTEVRHKAIDSKAFIKPMSLPSILGVDIVPMDFLVKEGLEFKFTLICYDDWNEVLIDQNKIRGRSSADVLWNRENNTQELEGLFWSINIDKRHKTLIYQLKLNEDLIDYCDIKEVQQRPMKSEVNISSSTSIEDKDLDADITEQLQTKDTPLKGWVVQLGLFSYKINAERLRKGLLKQGWEGHLKHDGKRYGIYVGPAKNRVDAEALQKNLRNQVGLSGVVKYLE